LQNQLVRSNFLNHRNTETAKILPSRQSQLISRLDFSRFVIDSCCHHRIKYPGTQKISHYFR
jgi:hypothetical protein